MNNLPPDHFLALPRPDIALGPPAGVVDTTTLAAHDFDVDTRTGFMPPQPPLTRLPGQWAPWEELLDEAQSCRLQLGSDPNITKEAQSQSEAWRNRVRHLHILAVEALSQSELLLRRAHHVLSWTMHFYIHSLPPDVEVRIPAPVSIPLLRICHQLQLPPVVTYSDDVLYNWALKAPSSDAAPALENLRCLTTFTGTKDEEEFYLSSARIELRGVEALEIMRATMDELFVGDKIALRRITRYMHALARVVDELAALLLRVRDGCAPDVFYRDIRPWFNGADSGTRKWVFEGLEAHPEIAEPTELSGPSAAQSSLVHSLDIFLGVDHYSHSSSSTGLPHSSSATEPHPPKASFLDRMQSYMPRHHRNFLRHLAAAPRPLRETVGRSGDAELVDGYNAAVASLKAFRDVHMRIVALYIVIPARRFATGSSQVADTVETDQTPLKGTGGTDLVRFLKGVRDRTVGAAVDGSIVHQD
ncbi:Indoleamine 2,3-dioxygenase [Artomyces pyxidatus]|uniref:Indoleamine 2,3-dioxygenase n=1 Tax=Artomyces pyxidatus TaxID=48021 RepID=A0ACB8SQW4_9AGAM|nr:Indoleamine 2,3-dioxygenase [Artomyces pyxidatus]